MLFKESKHDIFERLRLEWVSHHKRIQDLKQKRMLKFPQVYLFNYEITYDPKDGNYQINRIWFLNTLLI